MPDLLRDAGGLAAGLSLNSVAATVDLL